MKKEVKFTLKKGYGSYTVIGVMMLFALAITGIVALISCESLAFFNNSIWQLLALSLLVFVLLIGMYGYIFYQTADKIKTVKTLLITMSIIFTTVILSVISMQYVSAFAVPLSLCTVLVGVLVSRTLGFCTGAITAMIILSTVSTISYIEMGTVAYDSVTGVVLALIYAYFVMFLIKKNYTRLKLVWGALIIAIVMSLTAMAVGYIVSENLIDSLIFAGFHLLGSTFAIVGFSLLTPLYEATCKIPTDFRLAELCSLSNPLLKRMATEIPGTFNHCLIVANLAESCAIAIGENPFLSKACALYHDAGKLINSEYFVENQDGEYNLHDDLIPENSAKMIIAHANLGYKILKDYHLPEEVAIAAKEHHGTTIVKYFYAKACSLTEGSVDRTHFEYEGPKPTTKISAIIMIADVCEAVTRSKNLSDKAELKNLIDSIVNEKIKEDQFSDCDISFADLDAIKNTIIKVMPAIYHKRIDYAKTNKD